jgi:hypothetical protein
VGNEREHTKSPVKCVKKSEERGFEVPAGRMEGIAICGALLAVVTSAVHRVRLRSTILTGHPHLIDPFHATCHSTRSRITLARGSGYHRLHTPAQLNRCRGPMVANGAGYPSSTDGWPPLPSLLWAGGPARTSGWMLRLSSCSARSGPLSCPTAFSLVMMTSG